MISTEEIELSQQAYFKLLAKIRFSTNWYIFTLPFIAALIVYLTLNDQSMMVKFLLVYGLVNPLWILVYLYIHAQSDKAKNITIKRHYTIDSEKIMGKHNDGTESQFLVSDILKIKKFNTEMLLYFSPSEFIYLPFKAFDQNALDEFMGLLKNHQKL